MNKIKQVLIAVVGLMATNAIAQQDPHYSFFNFQMNVINPAYAGAHDKTDIVLGVRSQWSGVSGSPETQSIIFGTPLGKNLGIGASILNDKTFVETQTWVAIDFSYKLQLNEKLDLFLGLKASANNYNINSDGLLTYGIGQDGSLMDYKSRFSPNVGIGAYLKADKYYVSLSAPRILSNQRLDQQNGIAALNKGRQHIYLAAGYNLILNSSIDLQLSSIYRYVASAPSSLDIQALFGLGKYFSLGANYRIDTAIGGLILFRVGQNFKVGYAYESPTKNNISGLDNGSHEVILKIEL